MVDRFSVVFVRSGLTLFEHPIFKERILVDQSTKVSASNNSSAETGCANSALVSNVKIT